MFQRIKKIPYFNLIPILLISFVLYKIVNRPEILTSAVSSVLSIFSYVIWAFAIAYLLNPIMVYLENRFKLKRMLSITIIYLLFIAVIVFAVTIVSPSLVSNVAQLGHSMPGYIDKAQQWITTNVTDLQMFNDKYNINSYIDKNLKDILQQTSKLLDLSLNFLFRKTLDFTSTIFKLVFGLVISIYLLKDKEVLITNIKKFMYIVLEKEHTDKLITIGRRANVVFSKYIVGKVVDSIIVGVICFFGLLILQVPFALLISIIIGLTNLIPYIGSFVGIVPAVIILLFVSPIKALWALVFLIILQQVDGWIISPKIIGDQIGLSPLMIIIAIMVGGALYGVLGMFLAIPLLAVLKELYDEYVEEKLASKNIQV
ncbi:MAG: AI-2E family transporter [Clostridia bacterium]|nr:AI-2E family transporter [Clostridia bacterium]